MLSKYGYWTRLLKINNKLKISVVITNKFGESFRYFVGVLIKTIIPIIRLLDMR